MAENNTAFEEILKNAVEKAERESPKRMKYLDYGGNVHFEYPEDFSTNLSNLFFQNDLLDESKKMFTTRSTAFALCVLNSVDATKKIQGNIEDFFSDEANKEWFTKQGITTVDEKNKLKESLKQYVEEQLDVKPKTVEGRAFVQRMKDVYDKCADKDKDFFLQNGCAFIRAVNAQIREDGDDIGVFRDALKVWSVVNGDNGLVASEICDSLTSDYKALASDMDRDSDIVQHFGIYFGNDVEVKPTDFLDHAKTGKFTLEDKIWAQEQYMNLVDQGMFNSVEMTDFMVNGKPMFSEEDIKNTSMDELSCKLVENMLKGEDVSIKKPGKNDSVRLDVNLIELPNTEKKNFVERLFDHIKELFFGEKKKVQQMKLDFAATKEDRKAERVKITFEELSGTSAAYKRVMPPSKDKQLSAEHKLEKGGMSAGQ